MANRHLSRSVVMQSLFEWDFRNISADQMDDALLRNAHEFAPGMGDFSFIKSLAEGVLRKRDDIDRIIEKAAPEWPIDKISVVDRNILRIGLYELLFADRSEVPAKVAINEAIELAKTFGGDTSGKFVNGVLGAVYKELGEPGKDDVTVSKKNKFTLPYEEMPIKKLGGAVVYSKAEDGQYYLAFVHDVFGHWTLSKGGVSEDIEIKQGTKKEIKDELGIEVSIEDELATNEYIATHPEDGKMRKQVSYFLAEAKHEPLTLGPSGGLDKAEWFKLEDIADLNFYNDILPIVTKAVKILLSK